MHKAGDEPTENHEQLEHVAQRLAGRAAVTQNGQLDLLGSVGGLRGIAEATVPALVFLVTFISTTDVSWSAVLAVGLAALASVVRLVQRQPLTQALAGVFGVAVSAAVALMQNEARGYYVIGFYISAAYGAAFALSMAVKWPIMGLIYGWIRGEGVTWQKRPVRRRKYQIATLLMVLVFAARLIIQLPMLVPTGIAIAIPTGYAGFIHPRSGLAVRAGLSVVNAPGTIDAGYRGEIKVPLINLDPNETIHLQRGERIAQLVIQPVYQATFTVVDELPDSARRDAGFGSTGGFVSGR